MSNCQIALLASPSVFTKHLAEKLATEFNLRAVVWERMNIAQRCKMYHRRARRVGWLKVLDQAALKAYSSLFQREKIKKGAQELFGTPTIQEVPTINVRDIDDDQVVPFLAREKVTLCVVSGTGIIQGPLLEAYAGRLINIHTGWTPYYRGAHGGFWALYNDDLNHCGVTIHVIDRGIDTGGILLQKHVALSPDDPVVIMAWRQQRAAADSIVELIQKYIEGQIQPQHCKHRGKLYYSPGLSDYFHLLRKAKSAKP